MVSTKSIKKAAKSQLAQNWSKAYAAMALILMASLCIFLAEQLSNSLLTGYGIIKESVLSEDSFGSIADLAQGIVNTVRTKDFMYSLLIALFFIVLRFIIISPLQIGETKWYYSVGKGSRTYLSKLFFYYHSNEGYMCLLMFKIGQVARQIFYGIISFLAAIAALSLSIYQFTIYSYSGLQADMKKAVLYLVVAVFLALLGVVLYMLLMLKYFLAEYLFAAKNDFDGGIRRISACFRLSKEYMTGQSGRVISLAISFIPAILSCVLIIPILYVYPHIRTAFAILARDIIKQGKAAREAENN